MFLSNPWLQTGRSMSQARNKSLSSPLRWSLRHLPLDVLIDRAVGREEQRSTRGFLLRQKEAAQRSLSVLSCLRRLRRYLSLSSRWAACSMHQQRRPVASSRCSDVSRLLGNLLNTAAIVQRPIIISNEMRLFHRWIFSLHGGLTIETTDMLLKGGSTVSYRQVAFCLTVRLNIQRLKNGRK